LAKRAFDLASMQTIMLFEKVTGSRVKDYLPDYGMFVIEQGQMGLAIGKGAANIKRMEHLLKKKLVLVEFNDDVTLFAKNLVYPAEVSDIKEENGVVVIHGKDMKSKGMIFGREKSRLSQIKEIIKRHFTIDDVKVV
jgi:transcription termination/antitermination protein NusA